MELTLKLKPSVMEKAERYALNKKTSVSKIVESYLEGLNDDGADPTSIEISPFIRSLSTGVPLKDEDHKKEYLDHLVGKHQ